MSDDTDLTSCARTLLAHPADWPGEIEHFRRETQVLLDEIDRLRAQVRILSDSRQRILEDAAKCVTEGQAEIDHADEASQ